MQADRVDKLTDQWAEQRPELDVSGLDVVARIQDVAKLLRRNEDHAFEALDLQMWEYDVISALRRQGKPYQLPATELARESLLSSGAMTNRIDRMEDRGLVTRAADKVDRRVVLVALTEAGLSLADRAVEARLRMAEAQLSLLTPAERSALAQGLRKLVLSDH